MSHDKELSFSITPCTRFAPLLKALQSSLVFSAHSMDSLCVITSNDGITLDVQTIHIPRLLGVALNQDESQLALAAYGQILRYNKLDHDAVLPHGGVLSHQQSLYSPSFSYITGHLNTHDMAFINHELYFVNSQFSCIAKAIVGRSFQPVWQPDFITELAPEGRCHLNGMAIIEQKPQFATCFSPSNSKMSWRAGTSFSGALIRIEDNQLIDQQLCLPHSPRWHNGALYLCESGSGKLWRYRNVFASEDKVTKELVADLKGFVRGIKFVDDLVLVGLSRVRGAKDGSKRFEDMPLKHSINNKVGIVALDIRTGNLVAELAFTGDLQQIYDVELLRNSHDVRILPWFAEEVADIFTFTQK